MAERLLLLTGRLAEKSLHRVMTAYAPHEFTWTILNLGLSVAALMTADMIERRLKPPIEADRIIVPGFCAGDLDALSGSLGVPIMRGPIELKDLPAFLGGKAATVDLSRYGMQIFAEIVDAPHITIEAMLGRAAAYVADGADVIDIGCLPSAPFPHLEDAISALHGAGYRVSVDSVEPEELVRAGRAGADYLLSLKESTLWVADECQSVPVLIPEQANDIESLYRAIDTLSTRARPFIADSILDPIHFGFTASLVRYHRLRQSYPGIEIMMGTGNLTELTEADTAGMNAALLGIMSELRIGHLLTTQVSAHARSVVREIDVARRMFFAAHEDGSLPKGYTQALLALHERKPFPYSEAEIREMATQIRDPNYRVQVSPSAIHVYNRDGMAEASDPFSLYPELKEIKDDAPHAFYLGVELGRAQIALQLGKRYVQDEELSWGTAAPRRGAGEETSFHAHKAAGPTLKARRAKSKGDEGT